MALSNIRTQFVTRDFAKQWEIDPTRLLPYGGEPNAASAANADEDEGTKSRLMEVVAQPYLRV
jgi:hypothetical protein